MKFGVDCRHVEIHSFKSMHVAISQAKMSATDEQESEFSLFSWILTFIHHGYYDQLEFCRISACDNCTTALLLRFKNILYHRTAGTDIFRTW